jgi:hypothetical protein
MDKISHYNTLTDNISYDDIYQDYSLDKNINSKLVESLSFEFDKIYEIIENLTNKVKYLSKERDKMRHIFRITFIPSINIKTPILDIKLLQNEKIIFNDFFSCEYVKYEHALFVGELFNEICNININFSITNFIFIETINTILLNNNISQITIDIGHNVNSFQQLLFTIYKMKSLLCLKIKTNSNLGKGIIPKKFFEFAENNNLLIYVSIS